MNLDLMLDYGAESWKQYNEVLQDMLNRIQVILDIGITITKWSSLNTYLFCSGSAGRSEESNPGSELEQKEPTDSGPLLFYINFKVCFHPFCSFHSFHIRLEINCVSWRRVGWVLSARTTRLSRQDLKHFLDSDLTWCFVQAIMNMEQEHSYLKTQHQTRTAE